MSKLILPDSGIEKVNAIDLLMFQDWMVQKGYETRGYNEKGDLITETKDGAPLGPMWTEFQKTIALWNRQRDALVNLFTYNVSENVQSVRYPTQTDFEEASEFGEPKGLRLGPSFKMGFDFKWWDLAIRYTWQFLLDADADQLRALNNTALEADNRLVFSRVMRRIFNNTTNVATIDEQAVNVYPFWNGDTVVPPQWKNTVHSTGHQHFYGTNGATVDAGDLDGMEDHLYHHGYTNANGYSLLLLVNRQESATIRSFIAGTASARYTFIPGNGIGGGTFISANGGIVGRPNIPNVSGLLVIGTYGPWVVVEEDYIPAGYMVGLASGGIDNIGNPVGVREHPSLKGLRLVKGKDNDYPLTDSYYIHGMGTGVRHRGGGVVVQVVASTSYTIPAAYA